MALAAPPALAGDGTTVAPNPGTVAGSGTAITGSGTTVPGSATTMAGSGTTDAGGTAVAKGAPRAVRKRRHRRRPPAVPPGAAPTTAPTPYVAPYTGPLYQETSEGQVVPYAPALPDGQMGASTGGLPVGVTADAKPDLLVPGSIGRIVHGIAAAPMSAPPQVQKMIWAGNRIVGLPYIYGGGHGSFTSPGYDCSGTVSYALHGAALLSTPMDSSEFESFGERGVGMWVTIFTNPEHAYMTVAGLRLDTSAADDPSNRQGPRWRPLRPSNAGFEVRHPEGL
ncbi:MAG: hypothetical protein FWD42_10875 [Solirubrobacterales bacterium]|nr:hypothetical protein [Solirubrobacterales bacterium]